MMVLDAPRPDEIVLCVAYADGVVRIPAMVGTDQGRDIGRRPASGAGQRREARRPGGICPLPARGLAIRARTGSMPIDRQVRPPKTRRLPSSSAGEIRPGPVRASGRTRPDGGCRVELLRGAGHRGAFYNGGLSRRHTEPARRQLRPYAKIL